MLDGVILTKVAVGVGHLFKANEMIQVVKVAGLKYPDFSSKSPHITFRTAHKYF